MKFKLLAIIAVASAAPTPKLKDGSDWTTISFNGVTDILNIGDTTTCTKLDGRGSCVCVFSSTSCAMNT